MNNKRTDNKRINNKKKVSLFSLGLIAVAIAFTINSNEEPTSTVTAQSEDKFVKTTPTTVAKANQTTPNIRQLNAPATPNKDSEHDLAIDSEEIVVLTTQSMNPIERIKAIQHKTALHESILQDHEEFTRYPEYNARFEREERDPTVVRYELDERTTENNDDNTALTIWSNQKYYLHDDTVTVYASLRDHNGRAIPTQFLGQLIFNEQVGMQQLEFSDHNLDGVHEVSFQLEGQNDTPLEAGVYKVLVVNKHNETADAVAFTLSQPDLQLSGNYRDKLIDGSLLVEAEVQVQTKNRFYFQASLYAENGTPVGTSQHTIELEPGTHWIPLNFDGLMIRDSGESGPYTLKNISLAKVALPIQRAPLKSPEYLTQSYALEQFRDTRYASN